MGEPGVDHRGPQATVCGHERVTPTEVDLVGVLVERANSWTATVSPLAAAVELVSEDPTAQHAWATVSPGVRRGVLAATAWDAACRGVGDVAAPSLLRGVARARWLLDVAVKEHRQSPLLLVDQCTECRPDTKTVAVADRLLRDGLGTRGGVKVWALLAFARQGRSS